MSFPSNTFDLRYPVLAWVCYIKKQKQNSSQIKKKLIGITYICEKHAKAKAIAAVQKDLK